MSNRLQRRLEQQNQHSIDISPLIDVVFILLIFFIVSTVFVRETGVEVDKPQAFSAQRLEQTTIMLAITDQREVFYDGKNIGVDGVRGTLEQLLLKEDRPVVIIADRTVAADLLMNVIDEVKLAGVLSVSIAAQEM